MSYSVTDKLAADVLNKVLTRLRTKGWRKDGNVVNNDGNSATLRECDGPLCLLNTLMVFDGDGEWRAEETIRHLLFNKRQSSFIASWNDAPERTFEEVEALVLEAIEEVS